MYGHRRSIRLKGFDYSRKGYYFMTVDCWKMMEYFGEYYGRVQACLHRTSEIG